MNSMMSLGVQYLILGVSHLTLDIFIMNFCSATCFVPSRVQDFHSSYPYSVSLEGPLQGESSFGSSWNNMHISWWKEDRNSWTNWQWKIYLNSGIISID